MTDHPQQLAASPHDTVRRRLGRMTLVLVPLLIISVGSLLAQQVGTTNELRQAERASHQTRMMTVRL